jgi:hypothetical protein
MGGRDEEVLPRPEPRRGGRPPGTKATATDSPDPDLALELTCLACGHTAVVPVRGAWRCVGGAEHDRVLVHAPRRS